MAKRKGNTFSMLSRAEQAERASLANHAETTVVASHSPELPMVVFPGGMRRFATEMYQAYLQKNLKRITVALWQAQPAGITIEDINAALEPIALTCVVRCGYKLYRERWTKDYQTLVAAGVVIPDFSLAQDEREAEAWQWAMIQQYSSYINKTLHCQTR
jgi:hypothetical protein